MNEYLKLVAAGKTLDQTQAQSVMHILMSGRATPEQIAGFLMGVRSRGETADELVGFTTVMREYMIPVVPPDPQTIDVCGTGGDGFGTFNISTTTAFVCAGAGVTVAKHGNRSVSSNCGSSDVLAHLGVNIEMGAELAKRCLEDVGVCFLFAPLFHPAVGNVMPVRRALGARTFFNVLGPICNPANVTHQFVGAFNQDVAKMMAEVSARMGSRKLVVVHSADGMDELSIADDSHMYVLDPHSHSPTQIQYETTSPEKLGIERSTSRELSGGTVDDNAKTLIDILDGEVGPKRDVVILNASYALWASDKFGSITDCKLAATESIDSGRAKEKLAQLIDFSARKAQ